MSQPVVTMTAPASGQLEENARARCSSVDESSDDADAPTDHKILMAAEDTTKDYLPHASTSEWQRMLPVTLILSSAFLFSGMHVCVRYTSHTLGVPVPLIAFGRGVLQLAMCSVLILYLGPGKLISTLTPASAMMLAARGALGATAMWCKYEAVSRLPIAVAACVFTTAPIFASLLSWLVHGEKLSRTHLIALFLTTVGAVMVGVSDGEDRVAHVQKTQVGGVLSGLLASVLTGIVFVLIRFMGSKVHFLLSVQALSIGAILVPMIPHLFETADLSATLSYFFGAASRMPRDELWGCLMVGLCAFAAASCLNRGLQLMEAGRVALIRASDLPINLLVGLIFLGELPNTALQVVGCVLIACSTYTVVAEQKS